MKRIILLIAVMTIIYTVPAYAISEYSEKTKKSGYNAVCLTGKRISELVSKH